MSRIDENEKLHLPSGFHNDMEIQIAQAKFLEDISRSLAVIADCCLDEWQKSNTSWDISWNNKEDNDGN